MTFRPPKKFPRFADLKGILAQTKKTEEPLYQTVQLIIERLDQLKDITDEKLAAIESGTPLNFATKFATYHTKLDETAALPNSVQLLAGTGILFDDSVPNKRTISSGALHYDAPLTDGNVDETDLIFALGECIIVQVPVP
jgi:hypothetical protein